MNNAAAPLSALRVKDYMSSSPSTLSPEDRLLDADLLIRRAGVRHLPVLSDGRVVGLLSERDVRRYAPSIIHSTPEEYNAIFEQTVVGMVMTKEPKSITSDAPLAEAVSLLYGERLGCLLVVDSGQLVGIITRTDIMRFTNEVLSGTR